MNEVLLALCYHSCNMMDGWHPLPARIVAQSAGISLYKARKELRALKQKGLARTFSDVIEPEESLLPYHGWGITKAAYKTEEYKEAAKREAKLCEECFDIPENETLAVLLKEG